MPRSSPRATVLLRLQVLVLAHVQPLLDAGALLLVRLDEVVDQRLLGPARPRKPAARSLAVAGWAGDRLLSCRDKPFFGK